jgi:hypothetical protein
MKVLIFVCVLLVQSVSSGWSQTRPVSVEPLPPKNTEVTIPFRLYWDYLVVTDGSIGGLQKLSFLIDTGAYPSVIDHKIAQSLRLNEQQGKVNLSDKTIPTRLAKLPLLTLGPVRVESLTAMSEDLSFFQTAIRHRVDAIIGMDVMRRSSFSINSKPESYTSVSPRRWNRTHSSKPSSQSLPSECNCKGDGCG